MIGEKGLNWEGKRGVDKWSLVEGRVSCAGRLRARLGDRVAGCEPGQGHVRGDCVVGNEEVPPLLAAMLLGVLGGVFTPFHCGVFLGQDFGMLHLVGALGLAEEEAAFGFDSEVGLVAAVFVVVNLELAPGRFEPLQHIAVVFEDDGEAAFAVDVELLEFVQTFLKAAEEVAFYVRRVGYVRTEDAFQIKLRAFLEKEMRPWEKTFPDELWREFARLTRWQGSVTQRPKYWGKLVMELVYEYLDEDVANWLKNNAPSPQGNQSYHRWLTSQYGLRKLIEHIWMLIGMGRSCQTMRELRDRMAMQHGREPFLLNMYIPAQPRQD